MLMLKSRDANRKAKHGLGDQYTGPYVIVEVKGVSARLKNEKGVILKKMVTFDRLKQFHSAEGKDREEEQDSTGQQPDTEAKDDIEMETGDPNKKTDEKPKSDEKKTEDKCQR